MTHTSAFKTPEGEAAYLAAYDAAIKLWPVPYEEVEIPGRFGTTHVVASGSEDGTVRRPLADTNRSYSNAPELRCDLVLLSSHHKLTCDILSSRYQT